MGIHLVMKKWDPKELVVAAAKEVKIKTPPLSAIHLISPDPP